MTNFPGLPTVAFRSDSPLGLCRSAAVVVACCLSIVTENLAQDELPPSPPEINTSAPSTSLTSNLLKEKPIGQLRASLGQPGPSPANLAAEQLRGATAPFYGVGMNRGWCGSSVEWDAAATRSLPLYFEEPNLERMGYYYGFIYDPRPVQWFMWPMTATMAAEDDDFWLKQRYFDWYEWHAQWYPQMQLIQPVVSGAAFYSRVAILPYLMGIEHPTDSYYDLGAEQPGSPMPYRKEYLPLSAKGALYQGAAVTGAAYILP